MKYVVMGRLSKEAIAETMPNARILPGGYIQFGTPPMILEEAIKEKERREALELKIMDGPDETITIGKTYEEVWIEDEEGNKITATQVKE